MREHNVAFAMGSTSKQTGSFSVALDVDSIIDENNQVASFCLVGGVTMAVSLPEDALRGRVGKAIELLNGGDPDEFIEYYTPDVTVIVPVYKAGDAVGAPEFKGRTEFRAFLLRYLAKHRRYHLLDVVRLDHSMMISLECLNGDRLAFSMDLDEHGIGRRVMILHT